MEENREKTCPLNTLRLGWVLRHYINGHLYFTVPEFNIPVIGVTEEEMAKSLLKKHNSFSSHCKKLLGRKKSDGLSKSFNAAVREILCWQVFKQVGECFHCCPDTESVLILYSQVSPREHPAITDTQFIILTAAQSQAKNLQPLDWNINFR